MRHGALTAAVVLAGLVLYGTSACGSSSSARGQRPGASAGGPSAPAGASAVGSCTGAPLRSQLAAAVHDGASLIVATGTLSRKSVTGHPGANGPAAFYAITLRPVRTLRGPAVASGSTAWIPGPAAGTPANPVNSALLAPGGRLFAIVWPRAATHYLVGPTLQLAPIAGADVVFTPDVCWNLAGLQPNQYQENTPLRSVPGGRNFGGERQAAENGLYTVPLATVEQVAESA
jgi:hypothetical protein